MTTRIALVLEVEDDADWKVMLEDNGFDVVEVGDGGEVKPLTFGTTGMLCPCGNSDPDFFSLVEYTDHFWKFSHIDTETEQVIFDGEFDWGEAGLAQRLQCLKCSAWLDIPDDWTYQWV